MTDPAVSVVFRVFNCERFIKQALDNVLGQTFQDFEIVAVNDASQDNTYNILQTYAQRDQRVKVVNNPTNYGPVRTMNIGVKHARGEFIAVHDADDLSLPHRLETQVTFLQAHPEIALIGGGAYLIDKEGEILKVDPPGTKGPTEVRQELEERCIFVHTSAMYRRRCIAALGYYDEFFTYSHDYDMFIRMADAFDVVYYGEPLIKFRWMNSGVTGTKQKAQAVFAELARLRRKALKENTPFDLEQEYERLMTSERFSTASNRYLPTSEGRYYYMVGTFLLKKGEQKKARQKFLRALQYKDSINISARATIFWILSFVPGSYNSKLVRVLRKAF